MERPLNLNDGWEQTVNDKQRQERIDNFHAKRRQKKLDKMIGNTALSALGSLAFLALGLSGALVYWIASPVALILCCLSCFMGGWIWHETKF